MFIPSFFLVQKNGCPIVTIVTAMPRTKVSPVGRDTGAQKKHNKRI